MTNQLSLTAIALLFALSSFSQSTQNIRGVVYDAESLITLPGASVIIKGTDPLVGTSSDVEGRFSITDLTTGRISLVIQMVGYEDAHYDNLQLTSGKEIFLEVKLGSAFEQLNEVVVKSQTDDGSVLNEMATVSARSFSVEETQRYAASAFDPSRMASSFAGVTFAGDNIENMISVRGNSPRGIQWRLEGIEIPNPNHFGDLGSSGGGISMMSSSTLSNSDFYTGAFPSEFGNATSGVFDINFRNGNSEIREHSIMIGALGIEAATEGYFNQTSNASYLINYRYSTLGALSLVYQPLGNVAPVYQDLSFKVNLPSTPIGSLSFFGLAGDNYIDIAADTDTSGVDDIDDVETDTYQSTQTMAVLGMKHVLRLNDEMFLKTVIAHSINRYTDESFEHLVSDLQQKELYDITDFSDDQTSFHSSLNYKVDSKNTIRSGFIGTLKIYDLVYDNKDTETDVWTNYVNSAGKASQWEHYSQWKHRINKRLTSNLGYHLTYLPFNKTYSAEPRGALTYKANETSQLSLAIGLHSKPEHISTYFLEQVGPDGVGGTLPNKDLEISKSLHVVLGYRRKLGENLNASAELYYQHQYDLPVEGISGSIFATQNALDIWDIVDSENLVSEGRGRNYGLDLSLSRPFKDGLYATVNGSLYASEYRTYDGDWFNTQFNSDYVLNLIGGKEFTLKKKNRIFGINGKLVSTGGLRVTPIDFQASQAADETIGIYERTYEDHAGAYFRFDLGLSYKVNREKLTHTILLDVQNVTNRLNVQGQYYDTDDNEIKTFYQTGLFPFINYRVEFQGKRKGY